MYRKRGCVEMLEPELLGRVPESECDGAQVFRTADEVAEKKRLGIHVLLLLFSMFLSSPQNGMLSGSSGGPKRTAHYGP